MANIPNQTKLIEYLKQNKLYTKANSIGLYRSTLLKPGNKLVDDVATHIIIQICKDSGDPNVSYDYAKGFVTKSTYIMFLFTDTIIIGFVAMRLPDPKLPSILIEMIWVDPSARGSKIGPYLINLVAVIGKHHGKKFIRLGCSGTNQRAFKFYLKNGFKVAEYIMVKKIG